MQKSLQDGDFFYKEREQWFYSHRDLCKKQIHINLDNIQELYIILSYSESRFLKEYRKSHICFNHH